MANKISQLTSAGALAGTEAVWVESNPGASGLPRKTTTQDIANLASSGSQTPWTSDIDGAGFGLDNIDRLEIQAPGVPGDTVTFTHDGTDFNATFANTTDWDISGLTGGVVLQDGMALQMLIGNNTVSAHKVTVDQAVNVNSASGWVRIARCAPNTGRGMATITLAGNGGGFHPGGMKIHVASDWTAIAPAITILGAPTSHSFDDVRAGYDATNGKYIDVSLSNATAGSFTIIVESYSAQGGDSHWEADFNATPFTATNSYTIDPRGKQIAAVDDSGNYNFIVDDQSGLVSSVLKLQLDSAIGGEMVKLKDTGGAGAAANPYIAFYDSGNTRQGYVGVGGTGDQHIRLHADIGNVALSSAAAISLSSGANSLTITPGASDTSFDSTQNIHFRAAAGHFVYVYRAGEAMPFRVYDGTGADYIAFSHGGANADTTFSGTTDWNITGLTGQVSIDSDVLITGTGADGDRRLIVEADSDNWVTDENSQAEIWLAQDGRGVLGYFRTTNGNRLEIGSSATTVGTFTTPVFSWAFNSDTVECHGPLNYTGINVHDNVNTFIRYYNPGWTNATTHDVLKNTYTVTTGDILLIKASGNSANSHGILGVGDNGLYWGRTDQETSLSITNSNTPFDSANYFRVDTSSFVYAHAIHLDTEERVLLGTANGARVQAGHDGGGHSGVFGSTQQTDAGTLDYRTYWAYDAHWDEVNNQWEANRTTLGKKWVAEMGYHQDSFTIRRFDGTVSAPWADSAWSTFFTVKSDGEVEIQSAGGNEMLTLKDTGGAGTAADPLIAFRDSANTRIGYVGVGSGSTNDVYVLSDSGSIQLTAGSGTIEANDILDMNGNNINDAGRIYLDALYMNETSAAQSDVAGDGQLWTKNNAPTDLYFTTDNGLDYPVAYARYRVTADTTLDGANVSETLGVQHINGVWYSDNATAYTLTLQASGVTTFPVGAQMTIWNEGSGTLTINEGASTTLYLLTGSAVTDTAGGCTMGQGGYATLIRKSTTVYLIMGSGITA